MLTRTLRITAISLLAMIWPALAMAQSGVIRIDDSARFYSGLADAAVADFEGLAPEDGFTRYANGPDETGRLGTNGFTFDGGFRWQGAASGWYGYLFAIGHLYQPGTYEWGSGVVLQGPPAVWGDGGGGITITMPADKKAFGTDFMVNNGSPSIVNIVLTIRKADGDHDIGPYVVPTRAAPERAFVGFLADAPIVKAFVYSNDVPLIDNVVCGNGSVHQHIYVTSSGKQTNDGLSWATAKGDPNQAFEVAGDGDEIWVAKGTYTGVFTTSKSIAMYGGFAGNESQLSQRDVAANPTTLAGTGADPTLIFNQGGPKTVDGFTVRGGKAGFFIDSVPIAIANCHVTGNSGGWGGGIQIGNCPSVSVTDNEVDHNTCIGSGGGIFLFRVGSADAPAVVRDNDIHDNSAGPVAPGAAAGGGICGWGSFAAISHNQIRNNLSPGDGGGIWLSSGDQGFGFSTVANNEITNNTAVGSGGGIHAGWYGGVSFQDNTVRLNSAGDYGGGLYLDKVGTASQPSTVQRNNFELNFALTGGEALQAWGDPGATVLTITDNKFADNNAGGTCTLGAGGFDHLTVARNQVTGSANLGVGLAGCTHLEFSDNYVASNQGGLIGGMGLWGCTGEVARNTFEANSGSVTCALHLDGCNMAVTANRFVGNIYDGYSVASINCFNHQGPIANNILQDNATNGGPTLRFSGPAGQIVNNTFVHNTGDFQIGVWPDRSALIANNIVASGNSGIGWDGNGTLRLSHNDVFGNGTNYSSNVTVGTTDITVDPRFVAGSVHLSASSPCIDAGDSSLLDAAWTDYDGLARVAGPQVDIGACEFQGTPVLEITDIVVDKLGLTTATVSWRTNRPATGVLDYGMTSAYGKSAPAPALACEQGILLSNLLTGGTQHFRITATDAFGRSQQTVDLTFTTLLFGGLQLSATSVAGGATVTGTVALSGVAGVDIPIAIASTNPAAKTRDVVLIPAGSSSANFPVETSQVSAKKTGSIKAAAAGNILAVPLTVQPIALKSVALAPSTVGGGNTSTCTVTVDQAPTSTPLSFAVSTSRPDVMSVPSTITVPLGAATASFSVQTLSTLSSISAKITVGGKAGTLTIKPIGVTKLTLAPTSLKSNGKGKGTVTIAYTAPAGGKVVTLSCSNPAIVSLLPSVLVPEGATSASFDIVTGTISTATTVTITVTSDGVSKSATLRLSH